jgi:hypothetical protein
VGESIFGVHVVVDIKRIQRADLKKGMVYRLSCHNILIGVYNGKDGFIGIREKFGHLFLDIEYLSRGCGGEPTGTDTATPKEELETVPDDTLLRVNTEGSWCAKCRKPTRWTGPPGPAPWECESGCEDTHGVVFQNDALFRIMKTFEEKYCTGGGMVVAPDSESGVLK